LASEAEGLLLAKAWRIDDYQTNSLFNHVKALAQKIRIGSHFVGQR
jgi:hypothetical protein